MICSADLSCGELILQLLVYGLSNGAVLALNAIAVTVVYGTVRVLNLAHGDIFALASVLVTTLITNLGVQPDWPFPLLIGALGLVLTVTLLSGAVLMAIVEKLAFEPFRGRSQLAPLMATLGLSFILFQIALIWRTTLPSWYPQDHRSVPGLAEVPLDAIPTLLPRLDLIRAVGLPLNVTVHFSDLLIQLVACGCALGVSVFLRRTRLGRGLRACAQNPQLAQLCGVNLDRTIRWAFVFGGVLVGTAAFVFALYYERSVGNHGPQSGLLAFTTAILGGIGSPVGALLSGLLIGICGAFSDYFFATQWTPVLLQVLLIGLLMLRPTGIMVEEQSEDLTSNSGRDPATATVVGRRPRLNNYLLQGFILVVIIFPAADSFFGLNWQILAIEIGIFIVLALGLNLLLGIAGLLDLSYAASFGLGAYVAALLLSYTVDFIIVLLLSALVAGLFGLLKSRLTLGLRSDYLAVVTLALGLMTPQILVNLNTWTGGTGGLAVPSPQVLTHSFSRPTEKYYLVSILVVGVILASQRLIGSRIGRAWLASSEDEIAAVSSGVDVAYYRALAFTLSSAVAGIAGALYAGTFAYVAPDLVDFQLLAMVLVMVIIGGAGSVPGTILGAILITGYDKLFIPWLGDVLTQFQPSNLHFGSAPDARGLSYLTFGLVLYLTVLFRARQRAQTR